MKVSPSAGLAEGFYRLYAQGGAGGTRIALTKGIYEAPELRNVAIFDGEPTRASSGRAFGSCSRANHLASIGRLPSGQSRHALGRDVALCLHRTAGGQDVSARLLELAPGAGGQNAINVAGVFGSATWVIDSVTDNAAYVTIAVSTSTAARSTTPPRELVSLQRESLERMEGSRRATGWNSTTTADAD